MFQGSKLFRKITKSKEQSASIIHANLWECGAAEFSILHSLHEKGSQSKEENLCHPCVPGFSRRADGGKDFPILRFPQDSQFASS